jgi:hypothetical protein
MYKVCSLNKLYEGIARGSEILEKKRSSKNKNQESTIQHDSTPEENKKYGSKTHKN